VIFLLFTLQFLEPEDSNNLYLMDLMLATPEEQFVIGFDSLLSGLYTNQGCLDLMNWYIELLIKSDFYLSRRVCLRYRYRKLGDYDRQIDEHRFEPTLNLKRIRFHLMISPKYYKGGDEIGAGFSLGDYLNYLEIFLTIPDFDRNFSLRDTPDTLPRYLYKRFPIRLTFEIRKRWQQGYAKLLLDRTMTSFQVWSGHETRKEDRWNLLLYLTSWHGRFNLELNTRYDERNRRDFLLPTRELRPDTLNWLEIQPGIGFRFSPKLSVYFRYRIDSKRHLRNQFDYHRSGNSQYLDLHYRMSDQYLWHFGYQGEYLKSGELKIVNNHRFIIGLEYIFPKGRFVLWEGIEADRPFRILRFHNHTYLSLLVSF